MDYLYAELIDNIINLDYNGSTTTTATTNIDNNTRTISVDVLKLPYSLTLNIGSSSVTFDGSEDKVFTVDLSNYYTKEEVNNLLSSKQDSLPTIINDRYLHTNASTGSLEWSEVNSSGIETLFLMGYSGTLTDEEYEKVHEGNCVIFSFYYNAYYYKAYTSYSEITYVRPSGIALENNQYHVRKLIIRTSDKSFYYYSPVLMDEISANPTLSGTEPELKSIKFGYNKYKISRLLETTWSDLKTLRDNSQLIPGMQYRITDYNCTTTQDSTSSAGHQFDIIVIADSTGKLNEEARVIIHEGDTYFANNKLEAWKIWYCIDNDNTRFVWADTTNGKGVIYRMIDEFGNDCPYDFKNILFTKSGKYENIYTFTYTDEGIKDASINGITMGCYNNKMTKYDKNGIQNLNFNVFYSVNNVFSCYANSFETKSYSNTLGNACYNNKFGDGCYNNTLGTDCYNNYFNNNCYDNTFGNYCDNNLFMGSYNSNTFGNDCHRNRFGVSGQYNKFGNNFSNNSFGNNCSSNTFKNYCYHISFGNNCSHNTFFPPAGYSNVYCKNIIFDNDCSNINFTCADVVASSSNYIQNVHVCQGVIGDYSSLTIVVPDRKLPYQTEYRKTGYTKVLVD